MGFKRRWLNLMIEASGEPDCPWQPEEEEQHKRVLQAYAPRLHFAAGERFFPMNVVDYIKACALRYRMVGPDLTISENSILNAALDHQGRLEIPADGGKQKYRLNRLYLQFVHEFNINSIIRFGTAVLMMILVFALGYAIQPDQLPALGNPGELAVIELKFGVFALLIGFGVLFQYNRKAFLGILLLVFAVMFFGDPIAILPGIYFFFFGVMITFFWFLISWLIEWFMETRSQKASILFVLGSFYLGLIALLAWAAPDPVRPQLWLLYGLTALAWLFLTRRGFDTHGNMTIIWVVHSVLVILAFLADFRSGFQLNYDWPPSEWLIMMGLISMFPLRLWIRQMHWDEVGAMQGRRLEDIEDASEKAAYQEAYREIEVIDTQTLGELRQKGRIREEVKELISEMPKQVVKDESHFEPEFRMSTKERFESSTGVSFHEELMPVIMLFVVLHFLVLWHIFGPGLLRQSVTADFLRTALFTGQIVLATSAVIWYYLDPLDPFPIRLDFLRNKEKAEEKRSFIEWFKTYRRYIFLVLVSVVLWFGGTYFVNAIDVDQPLVDSIITFISRLVLLIVLVIITVLLLGDKIVGFLLDVLSLQPDTLSVRAYAKYSKIKLNKRYKDEREYCYYGRISESGSWTVLFYQYFYAYNDWRSAVGGINNHEGDWEAVAVYIQTDLDTLVKKVEAGDPPTPFGMALSQHHAGKFKFWKDWYWKKGQKPSTRPNIYVARGSHANYAYPGHYHTEKFVDGWVRKVIAGVDQFIRKSRRLGDTEGRGLPEEFADGKMGYFEDHLWEVCVIDDDYPGWMGYRGLWGANMWMEGESGPLGPRWAFADNKHGRPAFLDQLEEAERLKAELLNNLNAYPRLRWDVLSWRDSLLLEMLARNSVPLDERKRALWALMGEEK